MNNFSSPTPLFYTYEYQITQNAKTLKTKQEKTGHCHRDKNNTEKHHRSMRTPDSNHISPLHLSYILLMFF